MLTVPAVVLGAFLMLLWLSVRVRPGPARVLCVNLCLLTFLYGTLEAVSGVWLAVASARVDGGIRQGYYVEDETLGYAGRPGARATARKRQAGELVYDVTYTLDEHGLRTTPDVPAGPGDEAVAVFGCSCAFGEGVRDEETLAFLTAERARRKVYNFGFHGYGPHQVLARIESGQVKRVAAHERVVAVYWTGLWHVARAAGGTSWDRHGPRYELTPDGSVRRAGRFDEGATIVERLKAFWRTSFVFRRFIKDRYRTSEHDVRLYLGIVRAASARLAEQYDGARFVLIYWDSRPDDPFHRLTVEGLRSGGIETYLVSDLLPGFREDPSRYEIGPHDNHPSAEAHRLLARFVADEILKTEP